MRNRRLILELLFLLPLVGMLAWQQWTIQSLRRLAPDVAGRRIQSARVVMPSESMSPQPGAESGRPQAKPGAGAAAPDAAALQAEINSLRQQNEGLIASQRQLQTTTRMYLADTVLSEIALSSSSDELDAASTRPPDTTGLRPDGQVASWSPRQVIGAPDTPEAGDVVTAWASRSPDGGEEWLQLSYGQPVDIAQINIHETYNPGAVSRITALLPDGSEQMLWQGTEPPEEAPVEVGFPVPPGTRSDQIRVYMDTARVPGWNEVDAVELVGSDGTRQWATGSTASSYYGDRR